MGLAIAIVGLLSGVLSLVVWYMKREHAPTPEERRQDLKEEYADTIENVHRLRARGQNAEAEAMLRRLRIRALNGRLRVERPDPGV